MILLLVGILCAGVAAGQAVKPRRYGKPLPRTVVGQPGELRAFQNELRRLQKLPSANRTVAAQVDFRSNPQNIDVTATYTIGTQPNDPLVAEVRRGAFRGAVLAQYIAGAPEKWSCLAPHLDSSASSAKITVQTSPWTVQLGRLIPVQERSKVSGSLTVTAHGLRLDKIDARIAPQTQDTGRAVWAPGPLEQVKVVLGTAGPRTPDTARWALLSFITNYPGFWDLVPWLVLLVAALRAPGAAARRFRTAGSCYIAAVPLLTTFVCRWTAPLLLYYRGRAAGSGFGLIFFVAPWFALWWLRERPLPRPTAAAALAVPLAAALAVSRHPDGALAIAAATAGAAGMAWLVLRSLATALPLAAFVPAVVAGTFLDQQLGREGRGLVYVACGLLLAPMAIGLVERAAPRRRLLWSALAVAAGVLCMLPYGMLSSLGGQNGLDAALRNAPPVLLTERSGTEFGLGDTAATTLDYVLIGVLVLLLARCCGTAAALGDPLVRGAALALPLLTAGSEIYSPIIGPAASTPILLAGLVWTIPASRTARAIGLAEVSRQRHAEQMRHELWTRLRQKAAVAIQRTARDKLAQGPAELDQMQALWQEAIDTPPPPQPDAITSAERALGSSGGYTPRQNAAFGLLAITGLALPLMLYESWLTLTTFVSNPLLPAMTVTYLAYWILAIFRWPTYGALYGLFYTQLRGRSPITKSCALFATILVPELLRILTIPSAPLCAALAVAGISIGQVVVLAIGLGLIWERRLALAAGLQWRQLRDFRTFGAHAPATTAVAFAVATTLATAFASETARALLQNAMHTVRP